MNFLDLIIIVAMVVFAGMGAYSGFLRQLSSPVALLGAWLFSWILQKPVGEQLKNWFANAQVAELAANTVSFAAAFLLIKIVWALIAAKISKTEVLGAGNRMLGALLGLLKGLALSCLVVLVLVALGKDELRRESVCAGKVYDGYQWFITTDFYKNTRNAISQAMENARNNEGIRDKVINFWEDKVKNLPQTLRGNGNMAGTEVRGAAGER